MPYASTAETVTESSMTVSDQGMLRRLVPIGARLYCDAAEPLAGDLLGRGNGAELLQQGQHIKVRP